jgi:hypothetical protein
MRRTRTQILASAGLAIIVLAAIFGGRESSSAAQGVSENSGTTLTAFRTDRELREFLRRFIPASRPEPNYNILFEAMPMAAPPPPDTAAPAFADASSPSITNTQEANVDEGGIVKMYGEDIVVILRRGRIFTVSVADGEMRPLDMIDAYPPGANARGDWYDEMLVANGRVIVIGYSYARGGTEINRFRIGADGSLSFEDAHHLRSNDYYSSRNYASRIVGSELILYAPLQFPWWRPVRITSRDPAVEREWDR